MTSARLDTSRLASTGSRFSGHNVKTWFAFVSIMVVWYVMSNRDAIGTYAPLLHKVSKYGRPNVSGIPQIRKVNKLDSQATLSKHQRQSPGRILAANGTMCAGYISIISSGRLGNQMCQYAALMGIAFRNSLTPVRVSGDLKLAINTFRMPNTPEARTKDEVSKYRKLPIVCKSCCSYDNRTEHLHDQFRVNCNTHINILLQGFFLGTGHYGYATDQYFHHISALIRNEFIPHDHYIEHASEFLHNSVNSSENAVAVGIHIRRGDFVQLRRTLHPLYFLRAIDYFLDKFGTRVHFVVASNDKHWAPKYLLPYRNINLIVSPFQHFADDIALMIQCDHIIISTGSFSWWAGYLSPGITITPREVEEYMTNWVYLPPSVANRTSWRESIKTPTLNC